VRGLDRCSDFVSARPHDGLSAPPAGTGLGPQGFGSKEVSLIVGIDIGGTKTALGVADHNGRLVASRRRGAPAADWEQELVDIAGDARALLAEAGVPAPTAIGISAPGPLDRARGVLLAPPNLAGWRDVPVVSRLAAALGAPAFLENDANAGALAEWRFGAGRGAERLVYLTLSTGLGAGLVLDGRLYRGRGDHAGEIGHAPIEWEGLPCACGLRGCLEAYVGGRAWTRRLRELAPDTSRATALAGGRQRVAPEHVVAAAGQGDAWAQAELSRWVDLLARGIVWTLFAYAPDAIVLGTIAAAAGEAQCLAPLRARVAAHCWPDLVAGVRISPAALWPHGAALAGVCAALEALGPTPGSAA
jgi:glucokinase